MRTLDRYVIREVLPPTLLALLIFTFLLVLPPMMESLENLLAKGVSWSTAARMLWLLVPSGLGLTIPMALLVGILIGLGRLSGDRESVALLACGVSPYRLLRPLGLLAIIAAAATAYILIVAIPHANQAFREIAFSIVSQRVETEIRPRVFFQDFPGWVLYARDEADPGEPGWKRVTVAHTNPSGETTIYLAESGRLVIDREERTVDLVLVNGTSYRTSAPGLTDVNRFTAETVLGLNPDEVFRRVNVAPGLNEKTIAQLQEDAAWKRAEGQSPHPEVITIQQKFSIPAACLVFVVIGLALGMTVARDGKLAGFVIGILVIFAYYIVMFLAESLTKGFYLNMYVSRWVPNIVLGAFGVGALVWRARYAGGRWPFGVSDRLARLSLVRRAAALVGGSGAGAEPGTTRAGERVARRRAGAPVLVVRLPRLRLPGPSLLDRYISRTYLKTAGLSFLALLGLFYISTFLDKSDKVFKGEATIGEVAALLVYSTPKFVYFIIPIAALLSVLVTFGLLARSSELTVMKACGISLYRASLSVVVLSLVFSAAIFGLEERVLARANRQAEFVDAKIRGRTPRVFDAVNRQWVVGRTGAIYHYSYFDPERQELARLTIYEPREDNIGLTRATSAARAQYERAWIGHDVRIGEFEAGPIRWTTHSERALPLEPPDYFESEQPVAEMMTVAELRRYVDELSASGLNVRHLEVELQHKLAFPFVTLVMTLLAVPFGVSTGRRGALYAIGLGIILALSFWILTSLFVALGKSGVLAPVLAAWTPNIIVLGAAIYVFLTVRT